MNDYKQEFWKLPTQYPRIQLKLPGKILTKKKKKSNLSIINTIENDEKVMIRKYKRCRNQLHKYTIPMLKVPIFLFCPLVVVLEEELTFTLTSGIM